MKRSQQLSQWVVLLLSLAILVNMVDRGNLATSAPLLRDELGLSNSQMGVLLSAFFWAYAPALPLAGLGWRAVFIGLGLVSLLWLVPWFLATRRGVLAEGAAEATAPVRMAAILRQRGLWGTSLGLFCLNYSYYFVLSWLPLILVKSRGFSVQQMAVIGAGVYCVHAVFCALLGAASDRLIRRGATTNRVRKAFIVFGSVGGATTIALAASADPRSTIWLLGLYGFFAGFTTPMIFAITQVFAGPRAAGQWYGLQAIGGQFAGIVAPIVTGLIVDSTGQFAWAFLTAAAVLLVGAFVWGLVVPRIEPIEWPAEITAAASGNGRGDRI